MLKVKSYWTFSSFIMKFIINALCISKILIYSVSGYDILCNCDDQKTGLTDDNVLRSLDQLPVKGNVSLHYEEKYVTYSILHTVCNRKKFFRRTADNSVVNVGKPCISAVLHGISAG